MTAEYECKNEQQHATRDRKRTNTYESKMRYLSLTEEESRRRALVKIRHFSRDLAIAIEAITNGSDYVAR